MSLATFSLGEPAIAQVVTNDRSKKAPPKRTILAVSDQTLVPEPR